MLEGDPPSEVMVNGTGPSEEKLEFVSHVMDVDESRVETSEGEAKTFEVNILDETKKDEGKDKKAENSGDSILTDVQDVEIVEAKGSVLVDNDNILLSGNVPYEIGKGEGTDRKIEDADGSFLNEVLEGKIMDIVGGISVDDGSKLDAGHISEETNKGVSEDGKTEGDFSGATETEGKMIEADGQVLGTEDGKLVVGNIPEEISKGDGEDRKREEVDASITNEGQEGKIVEAEGRVLEDDDRKLDVGNIPPDEVGTVVGEDRKKEVDATILTEVQEGKVVEVGGRVSENSDDKVDTGEKSATLSKEEGKTRVAEVEKTNRDQNGKSFEAEGTDIDVMVTEGIEVIEAETRKTTGVEDGKLIEAADSTTAKADGFSLVGAECSNSTGSEVRETSDSKRISIKDSETKDSKDAKFIHDEEPVIMSIDDAKELDAEKEKPVKATEAENLKIEEDETRSIEEKGGEMLPGDDDVKMDEADAVNMGGSEEIGEEFEGTVEKVQEDAASIMEQDTTSAEQKADEAKLVKPSKRKRSSSPSGRKIGDEGECEVKDESKDVEVLHTPLTSPTNRPVRDRKMVERLVEVIDKGPSREFLIEKGRGTALKDIPNVAYKISKKKPGDLKFLHQTLFGRRGKAINFKNHLLQFSGFVWHENEEKQRAKIKEKLDKCVKDALIDICSLFDILVSKTSTRKEDLIVKLLDFMAAPYATNDDVVSEEQSSSRSKKSKRVTERSTAQSTETPPSTGPRMKRISSAEKHRYKGKAIEELDDEDDVNSEDEGRDSSENGFQDDKEARKHSESDTQESISEETGEEDYESEDYEISGRRKKGSKKRSKRGNSLRLDKTKHARSHGMVSPSATPTKRSHKTVHTIKHTKNGRTNDVSENVFSWKKRKVELSKKTTTKSASKEKPAGKNATKSRFKSEDVKESGPSRIELRTTICEVLKKVDFSTATFTDILKQLAKHYNMDLSSRKKTIKLMIQEELTRLADEAEESEDGEDEGEGSPLPKVKTVKA